MLNNIPIDIISTFAVELIIILKKKGQIHISKIRGNQKKIKVQILYAAAANDT